MVDQSEVPPTRKKDGHCRKCGIKLSMFNLTKYCFSHQITGARAEDEKTVEMISYWSKYYTNKKKNK